MEDHEIDNTIADWVVEWRIPMDGEDVPPQTPLDKLQTIPMEVKDVTISAHNNGGDQHNDPLMKKMTHRKLRRIRRQKLIRNASIHKLLLEAERIKGYQAYCSPYTHQK